jgi:uncharacterized protein YbjT (DUF2867 family)
MKVVVFGATGTIGRPLVAELAKEHEVTAVSRREQRGEGNVTWAQADATDGGSVARVLEGAEVAYYLVHSLGARDFEGRDRAAQDCRRTGRAGRAHAARLPGRPRRRFA